MMLRASVNKLKTCVQAFIAPRPLRDAQSTPVAAASTALSRARKSTHTTDHDDEQEKCKRMIDYIFGVKRDNKGVKEVANPETKTENVAQVVSSNVVTTSDQGRENDEQLTPTSHEHDARLKATTAKQTEEQLAQKIETIDETPLVEAEKPKIEGFNVKTKVLGNTEPSIDPKGNRLHLQNEKTEDEQNTHTDTHNTETYEKTRQEIDEWVRKIENANKFYQPDNSRYGMPQHRYHIKRTNEETIHTAMRQMYHPYEDLAKNCLESATHRDFEEHPNHVFDKTLQISDEASSYKDPNVLDVEAMNRENMKHESSQEAVLNTEKVKTFYAQDDSSQCDEILSYDKTHLVVQRLDIVQPSNEDPNEIQTLSSFNVANSIALSHSIPERKETKVLAKNPNHLNCKTDKSTAHTLTTPHASTIVAPSTIFTDRNQHHESIEENDSQMETIRNLVKTTQPYDSMKHGWSYRPSKLSHSNIGTINPIPESYIYAKEKNLNGDSFRLCLSYVHYKPIEEKDVEVTVDKMPLKPYSQRTITLNDVFIDPTYKVSDISPMIRPDHIRHETLPDPLPIYLSETEKNCLSTFATKTGAGEYPQNAVIVQDNNSQNTDITFYYDNQRKDMSAPDQGTQHHHQHHQNPLLGEQKRREEKDEHGKNISPDVEFKLDCKATNPKMVRKPKPVLNKSTKSAVPKPILHNFPALNVKVPKDKKAATNPAASKSILHSSPAPNLNAPKDRKSATNPAVSKPTLHNSLSPNLNAPKEKKAATNPAVSKPILHNAPAPNLNAPKDKKAATNPAVSKPILNNSPAPKLNAAKDKKAAINPAVSKAILHNSPAPNLNATKDKKTATNPAVSKPILNNSPAPKLNAAKDKKAAINPAVSKAILHNSSASNLNALKDQKAAINPAVPKHILNNSSALNLNAPKDKKAAINPAVSKAILHNSSASKLNALKDKKAATNPAVPKPILNNSPAQSLNALKDKIAATDPAVPKPILHNISEPNLKALKDKKAATKPAVSKPILHNSPAPNLNAPCNKIASTNSVKSEKRSQQKETAKQSLAKDISLATGPLPKIKYEENIPLSVLLKRVRLRNSLEMCKTFEAVAEPLEARQCPPECPPPPCPIPEKKEKRSPCAPPVLPPSPPPPPTDCPPPNPPACPPPCTPPFPPPCPPPSKKQDPCKKKADPCEKKNDPCASPCKFDICEDDVFLKKNVDLDVTDPVPINIGLDFEKLGVDFLITSLEPIDHNLSHDDKENLIPYEADVGNVVLARDFEPWVPIPSYPITQPELRRPLQCPQTGCPQPPPLKYMPPKKCEEKPCEGFPKRSNSFSKENLIDSFLL